jgi:hypothetical protein
MEQHLEVGLVADSTLGGEHARPGDVLRVEPNCRGRGYASAGLADELGGRAGAQFAAGRSIRESFGDFFAVVVPPLRLFGLAGKFGTLSLSAMASCPFLSKVQIDQGLRNWERRHNAKARSAQRGHHHEEPASIRAADARGTFFAVHGLGLNVERIVFDDLLGLLRIDLLARNVIEVGIVPFEGNSKSK